MKRMRISSMLLTVLRPRHVRWGTRDSEACEPLSGDELMPDARCFATHAIDIHAPPGEVWKWIIQIGQDRGGFYSYTWLENLFGCRMRNTYRIVPELQTLRLGDPIRFHPKVPTLPVTQLTPARVLTIGPYWTFVLRPLGPTGTRLIIRGRDNSRRPLTKLFQFFFWEPAHFIMERKMMLRIKRLAEAAAAGCHVPSSIKPGRTRRAESANPGTARS